MTPHSGGLCAGDSCETISAPTEPSAACGAGGAGGNDVSESTAGGGSGNFGIQDQRKAMEWVQEHIADFSGDKDMVAHLPRACLRGCPCP